MSSSEWANRTRKAHSLLKERRSRRILTEEAVAQSSPSSLTNKVKDLSVGSEPLSPVRIQHRSSPVTQSPSQEETLGVLTSDLPSSPQPDQHPEDQRQRASPDESFSNERCASPTRIHQESAPPLQSPSRVESPERKKVLPRSPYRSRIHKSRNLASPSRIHQEPPTSTVPPSPPRQESQKELSGSPSSPDRYNQCQDTPVQSPLPKSTGMGAERQLVMLISVGVCDRQQATHQDRSLTILKGKGTPFTTVDGMDPSLKEVRNELFALSGIRGNYPQFFFAHPDGSTTYFGGWEKIEEINENSSLPPEILYNNPKIETWDSFFGGVVDRFSSDGG